MSVRALRQRRACTRLAVVTLEEGGPQHAGGRGGRRFLLRWDGGVRLQTGRAVVSDQQSSAMEQFTVTD